jgi:hypothetical protein
MLTRGNGAVASIRDRTPANIGAARPPFDQARADFERTWEVFLSKRTEADFQEWRDQRDWTARKYAMWERGEKLPSQKPNSLLRCPCGKIFDSHRLEETMVHVPHITATSQAEAGDDFFIAADILALVSAEFGLDGLPRRARADARTARASALAFFTALPCPPSRDWASPAAIS